VVQPLHFVKQLNSVLNSVWMPVGFQIVVLCRGETVGLWPAGLLCFLLLAGMGQMLPLSHLPVEQVVLLFLLAVLLLQCWLSHVESVFSTCPVLCVRESCVMV
jgi:hypothetical protein